MTDEKDCQRRCAAFAVRWQLALDTSGGEKTTVELLSR